MVYYEGVLEPFDTKYSTWIIAFCPDINSFFATNERHFFWESEENFESEQLAIEYFEHHINDFVKTRNEISKDIGGIRLSSSVYLENTCMCYEWKDEDVNKRRSNSQT